MDIRALSEFGQLHESERSKYMSMSPGPWTAFSHSCDIPAGVRCVEDRSTSGGADGGARRGTRTQQEREGNAGGRFRNGEPIA